MPAAAVTGRGVLRGNGDGALPVLALAGHMGSGRPPDITRLVAVTAPRLRVGTPSGLHGRHRLVPSLVGVPLRRASASAYSS